MAVKYGLAPWLVNIRAQWLQQLLRSSDGEQIGDLTQAQRIRAALTELGTTFIKLGQILSTRADLVGPELATELAKLQSDAAVDPPEAVQEMIARELGGPATDVFLEFDPVAFASASIGQVHHARLRNQTQVVVKVQHADIEERIQNDLEILIELARLAEVYAPQIAQYRPLATAEEFKRTLLDELDFTREQRNLARFRNNFADDPAVRFPATFDECCSRRVLTMELFSGISLSEQRELIDSGTDLPDLARRGSDIFLKMVFRDGFYHADPHPGNLMILNDSAIGIIDGGMVGRVDDDLREQIEDLLLSAIDRDAERMLDSVMQLGEMPPDLDRPQLKVEINDFVDQFASQSLNEFDLSGALNGMTEIIRRHRIILPSRVSLLIKMLVMLEGTSKQLSPDFSIAELLAPYRDEAVKRRLSPKRIWRKLTSAQRDWTRLAESLPGDVTDIMTRMRRGSFNVHLEHQRLDSVVNRLVLGIIAAALFVGSASLWSSNVQPVVAGTSVPGAVGCLGACWIGAILIRAIRKSGNI